MPIEHWMMFGTFAEQRHFVYPTTDTYTGVVINGNMAAYAPDGLAAFLLERTNLRYFIDPMTHAFQHDPSYVVGDDGEAKSSILQLAFHYDPDKRNVYGMVGKKPLLPRHLSNGRDLVSFVGKCLTFQETILADAMQKADAMKYLLDENPKLTPYALIAPYFYLTERNYSDWLGIQVKTCALAREIVGQKRLYTGVVLSEGLLSNEVKANEVLSTLAGTDVNGYILWVDNFDEQQMGETELRDFLSFSRGLRKGGERDVINLHGGYFSVLAAGNLGQGALTGVTHAPEFGEYRSVVPVGGGIPIARYYVPELHTRMRYRDALRLFQAKGWLDSAAIFHGNVCDCAACVETLNGDAGNFTLFGKGNIRDVRRGSGLVRIDFPTSETKIRCLQHYLQWKKREYTFAVSRTREELLQDLIRGERRFEEDLGDGVAYLDVWRQVFA